MTIKNVSTGTRVRVKGTIRFDGKPRAGIVCSTKEAPWRSDLVRWIKFADGSIAPVSLDRKCEEL